MKEARAVIARSGAESLALAPEAVLEALFATISYRLEPNGWATRFPVVLDHLHEGRVPPASAEQALSELSQIAAELAKVPADRVVWSLRDLRRIDDSRQPVRRDAASALDYFVARDGRPVIECLKEMLHRCRMTGEPLVLSSELRLSNVVGGISMAALGVAWGVVGYLLFPNTILVPEGTRTPSEATVHGPLLWPLGWAIAAFGAVTTAGALFPALRVWMRAHERLLFATTMGSLLLLLYVTWR